MGAFQLQKNGGEIVRYTYASYAAYAGKGCMSYCPNYRYPSHWHDDIEMSVILHGEMKYNVNGEIVDVREGDAFFINSRQLHFNFSENQKECEYICVLLQPMLLCISPAFDREFVSPLLANEQLSYIRLSEQILWQKEIREEIAAIYHERNEPAAPLLIQAHFCRI